MLWNTRTAHCLLPEPRIPVMPAPVRLSFPRFCFPAGTEGLFCAMPEALSFFPRRPPGMSTAVRFPVYPSAGCSCPTGQRNAFGIPEVPGVPVPFYPLTDFYPFFPSICPISGFMVLSHAFVFFNPFPTA